MGMMGKLKIGVIGAGSISDLHFQSYAKNEKVEIHAICDLNEERAEEKKKKYNAEVIYTNYEDLLKNPQIDAVSICTWNNSHAEIAIAALNAGKHVLVEKPLCKTVEEALRVEEAVKKAEKSFR